MNIPLISFIWLKGECRFCKHPISLQYPIVELSTGILISLIVYKLGITGVSALYIALVCGLICIAFIDWRYMVIPRRIVYPLLIVVLVFAWHSPTVSLMDSLWGLILGSGFLLLAACVYRLAKRKEGLGAGDIYLVGILGIFFGLKMPFLLLFASISALLYGLYGIWKRGKNLTAPLPYGSFLASWGIVFVFIQLFGS
jgi:leader peptidase (prepilin peptidase)/N-methyltransferase